MGYFNIGIDSKKDVDTSQIKKGILVHFQSYTSMSIEVFFNKTKEEVVASIYKLCETSIIYSLSEFTISEMVTEKYNDVYIPEDTQKSKNQSDRK
jgi:hypothetical protein